MAESKYGRLYTAQDVMMIASEFGNRVADVAVRAHMTGEPTSRDELRRMLERTLRSPENERLATFPAGEPLFVLRAQDEHAMKTLGCYYSLLGDASPDEHLTGVAMAMRAFAEWQSEHPDRVKDPD